VCYISAAASVNKCKDGICCRQCCSFVRF